MTAPSACSFLPSPTTEAPLLAWLLDALQPMNRTRVKQLLRHGRVAVNGTTTSRHDHPLRPGDQVAIARGNVVPADRSLENAGIAIVLEDEALIAIDKPAGLLTVATRRERLDTAFSWLKAHLTARDLGRPYVVHRLDRDTSGLLLFARNAAVRDRLQANWSDVRKVYMAVTEGTPRPPQGVVENSLIEGRDLRVRATRQGLGQWAVTRYRVVGVRGRLALVQVVLETGRKHQIRVHMAALGCPIIGDPVYGTAGNPAGRLGLHAHRLTLTHPTTGQTLELTSPLPATLQRVLE